MQIEKNMTNLLAEIQEMIRIANNEIESLPQGKLSIVMRDGKKTFFQSERKNGERFRRAINKDKGTIDGLARKAFLEKEISILMSNVCLVEGFVEKYKPHTEEEIVKSLPQDVREIYQQKMENRQPYHQSTYRPEGKVHTTSRGLKVRSKSEALIAEKLYQYNVDFRYEEVLYIGNSSFAPDFTIRTAAGETIYWEHCGLTGDERYMENHQFKLRSYAKAGIVPWENLIVTYDDENGVLNLAIVESEIENKIQGTW